MTIKGDDATVRMFENVGKQTEAIAVEAVRAAGDIVADAVRDRLETKLYTSPYSTGDLLNSFGVTPARVDARTGNVDVKIGFYGYDRKGVSNKFKARALESGTSKQKKHPFFRPAVNRVRKKAVEVMHRVMYSNFQKIQKG